jgi:hypothetical protein
VIRQEVALVVVVVDVVAGVVDLAVLVAGAEDLVTAVAVGEVVNGGGAGVVVVEVPAAVPGLVASPLSRAERQHSDLFNGHHIGLPSYTLLHDHLCILNISTLLPANLLVDRYDYIQ